MSTKVASLYAEIGADTTKLKSGLTGAKGDLKNFSTAAGGATSPLQNITKAMTAIGVAAGVVGAALVVAKRAFDFAREGAALDTMEIKFSRLARGVGAISDALMIDLRTATRGMVSDAQLVQSATDFMSLGLAKSREEVVRLTRVAGALGMNMNQLVLTLTNQTTMRFDALGVAVDGFEDRLRDLKATGLSTNEAFTEAFLQQAEAQIGRVGEVADTSEGAFKRLEAASANLKNEWLRQLVPAGEKVANTLANIAETEVASMQAGTLLREAEQKGVLSGQALYDMRLALLNNTMSYTDAVRLLSQELITAGNREEEYASRSWATSDAVKLSAEAVAFLDQTMKSAAIDEFWMDMAAGGDSMEEIAEQAAAAKQPVQNLMSLMSGELSSPMEAFIKDLEWFQAGGWRIEAAFNAIKEGVASGAITPEEGKRFTGELLKATEDIQVELGELNIDEAAKNISNALGITTKEARQYILGTDGIQGALEAITGTEWVINVKVNYQGTLPQGVPQPNLPAIPGQDSPNGWNATPQSGAQSTGFAPGGVYVDGIFIDGGGSDPEAIGAAVVSAIYDGIYTASRAGVAFSGV